jgi:hypothetical protein
VVILLQRLTKFTVQQMCRDTLDVWKRQTAKNSIMHAQLRSAKLLQKHHDAAGATWYVWQHHVKNVAVLENAARKAGETPPSCSTQLFAQPARTMSQQAAVALLHACW